MRIPCPTMCSQPSCWLAPGLRGPIGDRPFWEGGSSRTPGFRARPAFGLGRRCRTGGRRCTRWRHRSRGDAWHPRLRCHWVQSMALWRSPRDNLNVALDRSDRILVLQEARTRVTGPDSSTPSSYITVRWSVVKPTRVLESPDAQTREPGTAVASNAWRLGPEGERLDPARRSRLPVQRGSTAPRSQSLAGSPRPSRERTCEQRRSARTHLLG